MTAVNKITFYTYKFEGYMEKLFEGVGVDKFITSVVAMVLWLYAYI